jgi:acetyl esterase/lipase
MQAWQTKVAVLSLAIVVFLLLQALGTVRGQGAKTPAKKASSVKAEMDVPYADGGDEHMLDLYLPDKKGFTTVVFTFGGGWHTGSRKAVAPIGEKLQALGYGCALPSHRLSPQHKFPAQAEDIAAAFAWVKTNIAARGGDPKRVVLMGHSSGAQLSLLIAADPRYLAKLKLAPADIAAVIGLSAPVDLEPRKDGKGFGNSLMAGRGADVFNRDATIMRAASPLNHITKNLPPVLLIVGERDFPMLEGDAKAFVEKATAEKSRATMMAAKNRDHMGVVRALLEDKSDVLESVLRFLREVKN